MERAGDTTDFITLTSAYLRSAERLRADITDALYDLDFKARRGTILYAIDFTEIYSYVFPADESGFAQLFPELTAAELTALNLAILNSLFFGFDSSGLKVQSRPITLLSPYRVEFRGAEPLFQRTSIQKFQEVVERASAELERLGGDEVLRKILERLDDGTNRRDSVLVELLNYLDRNSANLLLLTIKPEFWSPQVRLRDFLDRTRLVDLSAPEIVGRAVEVSELDAHLLNFLHQSITAKRLRALQRRETLTAEEKKEQENVVRARSRIDALAIAYVARANDLMASKPGSIRRLVLITRSETMLSAMEQYVRTSDNSKLSHVLRRPGAFGATLMEAASSPEETSLNLKQRQVALDIAIDSLSGATRLSKKDQANTIGRIKDIIGLWRSSVNLTVAKGDWKISDNQEGIAAIVSVLRDKHRLNEIIQKRAAELAAEINLTNALLGQLGPTASTAEADIGIAPNSGQSSHLPVFLWSNKTPRTIGLYFYDDAVREARAKGRSAERALERLLAHAAPTNANFSEFEDVVHHTAHRTVLVESCLASSFLAAVRGDWKLAAIYANLAIDWSPKLDSVPRHEAYYMRAVCRRRSNEPTLEALLKGIDDLDRAEGEWRQARGNIADSRFLFERGVHLFNWWEHVDRKEANVSKSGRSDPSAERRWNEAERLFNEASRIIEEQIQHAGGLSARAPAHLRRQKLDIDNARCYIRVASTKIDDITFHLLVELLRSIRLCGWDYETVPLSILDTAAWALFQFRDRLPNQGELMSAARILASRLPADDSPRSDHETMQKHVGKMKRHSLID